MRKRPATAAKEFSVEAAVAASEVSDRLLRVIFCGFKAQHTSVTS